MRFDRLDLNLLVALDVLIEERNISRAAERLYITQPAMSGALGRLRDYFDDELLTQVGRRMIPTTLGIELGASAREALMLIRSRITTPSQFDPATAERRFTIMASDYSFDVLLSKLIPYVATNAPEVRLEIRSPETNWKIFLARGELDLFLSVHHYISDDCPMTELFKDEAAVICWSEGPYKNLLSEEDFLNARHATVSFGSDRFPAFSESFFASHAVSRRVDISVSYFGALPLAVVGTNRIATMHRRHAEYLACHYPLIVHPLPIAMPPTTQCAQWHMLRDTDAGIKWLVSVLKSLAAEPVTNRK